MNWTLSAARPGVCEQRQHNEGSVGTRSGLVCRTMLHVTAVESGEKINNAVIRAWQKWVCDSEADVSED